jgi:hypothetical protein
MRLPTVLFTLACAWLPTSAIAAPITVEFFGTVTSTASNEPAPTWPVAVGDAVTWRLTFDPSEELGSLPPGVHRYNSFHTPNTALEWSVSINGLTYQWNRTFITDLITNSSGASLSLLTSLSGMATTGPILDGPLYPFYFDADAHWASPIAPAFTLPTSISDGPITGSGDLVFSRCIDPICAPTPQASIDISFTSVSRVPEPASWLLITAGIAGLARARRQHR